eukprot:NODE_508_length_7458_cov_0.132491.p2 type:complete len:295 gc:universal NODE_508_length_7458_cov_0.132491:6791-5907(-)
MHIFDAILKQNFNGLSKSRKLGADKNTKEKKRIIVPLEEVEKKEGLSPASVNAITTVKRTNSKLAIRTKAAQSKKRKYRSRDLSSASKRQPNQNSEQRNATALRNPKEIQKIPSSKRVRTRTASTNHTAKATPRSPISPVGTIPMPTFNRRLPNVIERRDSMVSVINRKFETPKIRKNSTKFTAINLLEDRNFRTSIDSTSQISERAVSFYFEDSPILENQKVIRKSSSQQITPAEENEIVEIKSGKKPSTILPSKAVLRSRPMLQIPTDSKSDLFNDVDQLNALFNSLIDSKL